MKPLSQTKKFKLIKCVRCNIPNPYGSAHICDENDVADKNLNEHPEIEKWFKKGLRRAET